MLFSLARSQHKCAASLLGNRTSDQLEVLDLDPASVLQVYTLKSRAQLNDSPLGEVAHVDPSPFGDCTKKANWVASVLL